MFLFLAGEHYTVLLRNCGGIHDHCRADFTSGAPLNWVWVCGLSKQGPLQKVWSLFSVIPLELTWIDWTWLVYDSVHERLWRDASTLTCDNPSGLWRPMFVARSHLVIYLESQRKVLDAVLGDVAEDTWLRALINFYPFASVGETLIEGCETKWYLDPTQASSRLDVQRPDNTWVFARKLLI